METENQNIEYKSSWRDEYLKWICGFANAQGGTLYIGIDDSGKVCGLSDAHRLSEEIPNKIVSLLGIVADVNLLQKDGLDYIEIIVEPSNIPISLKGVYHYRSGSTKQELTGIALQQFILKKLGRSWDDIICEQATLEDIDRRAIEYFLRKAINAQRLPIESEHEPTESVLSNLNLVDVNGKLKNAAILLFAKNPSRFFTAVEFKIGRFGKDETDLLFQDLVEGNILQMTDKIIEILKSKYLISPIHYEGLQRIEPLEVPEAALREAIFNSIIHKDYMGSAIQMKVYNDRITLWNEGKLPEDFTIAMLLKEHSSRPRNKNIANAFYRAGFIESWGRGIKKICTGFIEAGFYMPIFEESQGGVLMTIYRRAETDENCPENAEFAQRIDENCPENAEFAQRIDENCPENEEFAQRISENCPENTEIAQRFDENCPENSEIAQRFGEDFPKNAQITYFAIQKNPNATISELSEILQISPRTVKNHIALLRDKYIRRVGSDTKGYWEIL